jgi:glycosyltransferase involved in cell wall biosynthesis
LRLTCCAYKYISGIDNQHKKLKLFRMSAPEAPQISVLMSVYNGLPYLAEAIESILIQSYRDFEFIIIDDCSSDGSLELIEEYARKDPRIRFIRNQQRLGLGTNLKHGVQIAKGEWIARMDADDISMPQRLAQQMGYVSANPKIDIVGSYAIDIDERGNKIGERRCPATHQYIIKYIWTCPIIHPTAFIRKSGLISAGSYGTEKRRQDYALWFRCAAAGLQFANLPEPLLKYRFTGDYFARNNLRGLLTQIKIGWKGCLQVKASPIAYIGVAIPLIKGLLPKRFGMAISGVLKKFDPRNR